MLIQVLTILFGFVILAISSKEAVKRIVKLARHLKISEFLISFLIVGTVAVLPELSIAISSALTGAPSFGLGILLGSNVGDLTLGLGVVAIATNGLKLHKGTIKEMKWYLVSSILPVFLLIDGEISRFDGALLLVFYFVYIVWNLRSKTKSKNSSTLDDPLKWNRLAKGSNSEPSRNTNFKTQSHSHNKHKTNVILEIFIILLCLLFLLGAGKLISNSSEELGQILILPLFFIGSIVALGTCLPEVSFAIEAGKENHADVGFGDILGVVFADCTLSIGIVALIEPIKPIDNLVALFTGIFMVISLIITMFLVKRQKHISRNEGFALLLLYGLFLVLEKFL